MPDTERKQESQTEIPAVRSFQFDHDSIGSIKNSVNLFRGEVNLSIPLVTLPGRGGLDVAVSVAYASNVQDEVKVWNRDAPTSVIGLGFDLPYERIEVNPRGSASLEDNLFSLVSGSGRTRLLRSDRPWPLFELSERVAAELATRMVGPELRAEFAARGVALSDRCVIAAAAEAGWLLEDPRLERSFRVARHERGFAVEDGGLGFETDPHQFWQIRYYPSYERWLLVDENGNGRSYGGSAGNGTQWGVRWGNWYGTSTVTEGQERYPVAWNLVRQENRWGDQVRYAYEVVEQPVGTGGLAYTKACYPHTITDTYGRSVLFEYEEKKYVADPLSGPREFADPHKPVPDDRPNAFQDRYETRYLKYIVVRDRLGQETYSLVFDHLLANVTGLDPEDPAQAELYGDTTKRYLASVIRRNHTGEALPGMLFDYYLDSDAEHPGALRSVTYPEGGVATYTYEEKDLPICQRELPIARPAESPREYWVPRVFFGPSFAVVAWFNTDTARLRLTVYTWLGFWYAWSTPEMSFQVDLDPNSMSVEAAADFFAFHYEGRSAEWTEALLFHQAEDALGRWIMHPDKLRFLSSSVDFEAGDEFLVALTAATDTLSRYTWSWTEKAFVAETFRLGETFCSAAASSNRKYYLGAKNNYYLVLCYDNRIDPAARSNCLELFHLDALGRWHAGGSAHPDTITIAQLDDRETFFWAPGETFAAATYVTRNDGSVFDYRVHIFHWDAEYAFLEEDEFQKDLSGDWGVPFVGGMIADSLVGSGPHLLRYNGLTWQHKDLGRTMPSGSENVFWFAYGDGMALMTQNGAGQIICTLGVYDPDTDSTKWLSEPAQIENLRNPPAYAKTRYYPTTGLDYVTLDRALYFRGTSNDWASVREKRPVHTIPEAQIVDTTTMTDEAPSFLAYLQMVNAGGDLRPARTWLLDLENGRVAASEPVDAQIYEIYDGNGRYRPHPSGKLPAGPEALVTWPLGETDFNRASEITLRRHVRGAMKGVIRAYPVVEIAIDSGLSPTRTSLTRYDYDFDTALCDPTGQVVKYFKASQFAAEAGDPGKPHGSTESIYINGLPADHESLVRARRRLGLVETGSEHAYSALDGYLLRQNVYSADGRLVSYTQTEWAVKTVVADAAGTPVPIRGSYVLATGGTQMSDGIATTSTYDYDLSSGQRTGSATWIYGSRGTRELHTDQTTYGYQVYPDLRTLNLLSAPVQSISWVQDEGAAEAVALKSSATRWKTWPRRTGGGAEIQIWDTSDVHDWRGGPGSPVFTAWPASAAASADWQRSSAIVARSEHGLVVESLDALGRTSSTLYDENGEYTVATFGNASLLGGEADYLGFEDYEIDAGWRMAPSGGSWAPYALHDQGHTGRRCLQLSASTTGDQRLEKTFTPRTQDGRFLFSAWYKTPSGFTTDEAAAAVEIAIVQSDVVVETITVPFEDTQAEWRYVSRGIDLARHPGGPLRIRIAAKNATAPAVLLDDLRLSAFVGSFGATVYDTRFDLQLAALGPDYETSRVAYDEFQRAVANAGPIENVSGLAMTYLSRQAAGVFSPAMPNASLAVQGTGAGFFADFFRDGGYDRHFSAADPALWRTADGALVYEGQIRSQIELANPAITARWVARVTATPRSAPTRPLGLLCGERLTISWDPASRTWSLADRGQVRASRAAETPQRDWLLAVVGRAVLFFADGQPIFSELLDTEVNGRFGLFAGDPIAFTSIAVCDGARLAQTFSDGAAQDRQKQALDGEASVVGEAVYDTEGRGAVQTKAARLAPTAGEPLLAYRAGFVESMDWVSGVMTGEISRYYSAGGGGPTDDQGYPYSRERYEDSPLGRVVEKGRPGKAFAIVDLATTTPADRHTTKMAYGANTAGGFMGWLPAGQYKLTEGTGPDGNRGYRVEDALGTLCGEGALVDPGAGRYNTTAYEYTYSSEGTTARTRLPNAFDPPRESSAGDWEIETLTDLLGRTIRVDAPDVGLAEIVFDPAGQRRFEQPAQARAGGYYLYHRYDAAGRVVEDGYLVGAWDRAELQRLADQDPSFPVAPLTWSRRSEYDGDGSDPLAMSRLTRVLVSTGDGTGAAASLEEYRYDEMGNVREHVQELPAGGDRYATAFEHDNLGSPTRIRYLAAAREGEVPEVTYGYDALGRVSAVGSGDGAPDAYARYAYNADGSPASTTYAAGTAAETARTFGYDPPGWPTSITDRYFSQQVYYDRYRDGQTGYYDGRVAEETFALSQVPEGGLGEYGYRYRYDALSQITEATTGAAGGNLKIDAYDDNGNPLEVERGPGRRSIAYWPGTDEIKNVSGGTSAEYEYDAGGAAIKATPQGLARIDYDRTTRLVRAMQTASGDVSFQYDGRGRRILEDRGGARRIYLHGGLDRPLVELSDAPGAEPVLYVYGKSGLLGLVQGGRFWLVLRDRLGSSRVLVADDGSAEGAYAYRPFGDLLSESGTRSDLLSFLFTGQKLDRSLRLYDLNARFYDPSIGRFLGTDPKMQFASPYVYAGNAPMLFVDPTGQSSDGWKTFGIVMLGLASVATAIAGVAVTVFTAGAGGPMLAAALGIESTWASTLVSGAVMVTGSALGSALVSGGTTSASYSFEHLDPSTFSGKEWFSQTGNALWIGAATGAISGAVSFGTFTATQAAMSMGYLKTAGSMWAARAAGMAAQGITDGLANVGAQAANNWVAGAQWSDGLTTAFIAGAMTGAVSGYWNMKLAKENWLRTNPVTGTEAPAEELPHRAANRAIPSADTNSSSERGYPDMTINLD